MKGVLVIALRDFRHSGLRMETGDVQRVPSNVARVLLKLGCVQRHAPTART